MSVASVRCRSGWAVWAALGLGLASGCILEDNPDFVAGATEGSDGSGGSGGTGGTAPTSADASAGPTSDTGTATMGVDTSDTSDTSDTGGPTYPDVGCNDPAECTVMHVGPIEGSCPHDVDGATDSTCDFVGDYALRIAAGTAEAQNGQALIIMHPDGTGLGRFVGGVEIPGDTTVTGAEGVTPEQIEVYHAGDVQGTLRLIGDSVYVQGFTLMLLDGANYGFRMRDDVDAPETETGGHLIENMIIAVTAAEDVGGNSLTKVFESIGPDTTIINNHIWGYFEGDWGMQSATRCLFAHNTVVAFQSVGSTGLFDARNAADVELSNNVILLLTNTLPTLVRTDDLTESVLVAGNHVEGAAAISSSMSPDFIDVDNTLDDFPGEAPEHPVALSDATLTVSAMGTSVGRSLDGVVLADTDDLLPGAFQVRSSQSGPRRTTIRVGSGSCGAEPCDLDVSDPSEVQHAIWQTWPGGTLELYPSAQPFDGPGLVTWPMTVRGMGTQPDEVVVRRDLEDDFLIRGRTFQGSSAVMRFNRSIGSTTLLEMMTIETGAGQIAVTHEGVGSASPADRPELRRLILQDTGALGLWAMYLGTDVVAHDILIHGAYETCVRFGPRTGESSVTNPTTTYVHHLTCRLTQPLTDGTQAVFDVAAVDGTIIADIAAELSDPGAIFRAQRRNSTSDAGMLALDAPTSFVAHSLMVRGHATIHDDYDPTGVATVTALTAVAAMDPFFVSNGDGHLTPGVVGIDGGVDPSTLDPGLSLGISVDGIDRAGQGVDRGCYEQ